MDPVSTRVIRSTAARAEDAARARTRSPVRRPRRPCERAVAPGSWPCETKAHHRADRGNGKCAIGDTEQQTRSPWMRPRRCRQSRPVASPAKQRGLIERQPMIDARAHDTSRLLTRRDRVPSNATISMPTSTPPCCSAAEPRRFVRASVARTAPAKGSSTRSWAL